MSTIQLKSFDNEIYEIDEAIAAKQSVVIANMLELEESEKSNGEKILIPLPNISGKILKMVLDWIMKHDDKKLTEKELRDWENEFVEVDLDVMYELIMAANYMEVNELLHRACQRVADHIAGKQPEEIRRIFNIENDFSPEEEAEIRRQNAWVFDSAGSSSR